MRRFFEDMEIKDITIAKIRKGELKKIIPELYELKEIVENNSWHPKESVFDHTISVLNNLEKIIKKSNEKELNALIGKNSRKDLVRMAAVLHDVGKKETIVHFKDGSTACPKHEPISTKKSKQILRRFNLLPKERKIILDIITNHGKTHEMLGILLADNNSSVGKNFKRKFSKIYLEMILLGYADTFGANLRKNNPSEFKKRINFYKKELRLK